MTHVGLLDEETATERADRVVENHENGRREEPRPTPKPLSDGANRYLSAGKRIVTTVPTW